MGECCGGSTRLIYACSGAADVGAISDQVARRLSKEGFGGMTCLAAIGANLSGFVESAKSAENIVIDGCNVACGRKNLERIGVSGKVFILTDMGLVKGKTPVEDAVISEMAAKVKQGIGKTAPSAGATCACNGNCG
ncbi:MAG: putative zinc-binding protein [candidate division FCPU426 bacterium]